MSKFFNPLLILFTQILLGQSMNGYSYDQVIDEFQTEKLRPMHSVNVGGYEIKSLLLEKEDYRVSYVFDKNEICVRSIVMIDNDKTLKSFLNFMNNEFEYIGQNRWISKSGRLCVEYDKLGGSANFKMINCPQTNVTSKSQNNLNIHEVISEKAFFYSSPNIKDRKKAYLVFGERFREIDSSKDFIYTEFKNAKGVISKGWIRKSDVSKL